MKHLISLVAMVALIATVDVSLHSLKLRRDVDAQDAAKELRSTSDSRPGKSPSGSTAPRVNRPFPAFGLDDIIAKLTPACEKLIQQKQAKGSDELRKQLDRKSFALRLAPTSQKELTGQELYRKLSESVYLVAGMTRPTEKEADWKTSFSTAFVVHEEGILSTSAHVFDHEDHDDAVVVLDVQGNVFPVVEVLAADRKADTLLFRIAAKGLKPLPLAVDAPPGSVVRVMGHPGDSFFFFSAGFLSNYERDEEDNFWLNVTADFGQGSSGGPVTDEAGNVIGQVSRTYTLYARGEASRRGRQPRFVRVANPAHTKKPDAESKSDDKKFADPQMVFRACTPVSALRELVK